MDVVLGVAQKHNLLVIEDSYDALGSRFGGRLVGLLASLELLVSNLPTRLRRGRAACW